MLSKSCGCYPPPRRCCSVRPSTALPTQRPSTSSSTTPSVLRRADAFSPMLSPPHLSRHPPHFKRIPDPELRNCMPPGMCSRRPGLMLDEVACAFDVACALCSSASCLCLHFSNPSPPPLGESSTPPRNRLILVGPPLAGRTASLRVTYPCFLLPSWIQSQQKEKGHWRQHAEVVERERSTQKRPPIRVHTTL